MKISNLIPILPLLITPLFSGCEQQQEKAPPSPPPKVTVAVPMVQDVTNYVYFTGYTEARKSVDLQARVEGYLESFSFTSGQMVKKGELLFSIDPKPLQAKLAEAQADLETRRAAAKLAEATLKRKESAYKQKAVSELAVLEAKATLSKSQAQVKGAEAAVTKAELDLSYASIHAPTSGRMGRNLVDAGNLVGAGGEKTLLGKLVNYDPIYVYFNVDERSLMLYKEHNKGQDLHSPGSNKEKTIVQLGLEGEDGYPHAGFSDYMDNTVDLATGTIQVRAVFDNHDLFIEPGQFSRVRVPVHEEKAALLVPDAALAADQRGRYLLTVNEENIVEYRPVVIGAQVDSMRVIRKGITQADRVVVKGIQRARPGAPVTPVDAAAKQQASAGKAESRQ